MKKKSVGTVVATAAFGLMLAGNVMASDAAPAPAASASVKCKGINECKSKGACHSASDPNGCGGKNECKGKGITVVATEKECTDKKGTIEK